MNYGGFGGVRGIGHAWRYCGIEMHRCYNCGGDQVAKNTGVHAQMKAAFYDVSILFQELCFWGYQAMYVQCNWQIDASRFLLLSFGHDASAFEAQWLKYALSSDPIRNLPTLLERYRSHNRKECLREYYIDPGTFFVIKLCTDRLALMQSEAFDNW